MKNFKHSLAALLLIALSVLALFACTGDEVRGGVAYNGVWVTGCETNDGSVVIEDGTVGITTGAFAGKGGITEIKIPDTVTTVLPGAFDGCDGVIEEDGGVLYVDRWAIDYVGDDEVVALREGTVGIADEAFAYSRTIKSVTVPDTVKNIGKRAFYGCDGLVEMSLPFAGSSLYGTINTHLGYVFGASSSDKNADYVPKTLTKVSLTSAIKVDGEAFRGCDRIIEISLADTVLSIGDSAFRGCTALNTLKMSEGVSEIGEYAFYACHGLTDIKIPEGVRILRKYAFTECKSLTAVTVPESVTVINACVFGNCENLVDVTLPSGLTFIGQQAFDGCNFMTDITIPTGDEPLVIDVGVFNECESLARVTLGDNVTSIGENAFYACRNLSEINVPSELVHIGEEAFSFCQSLESFPLGDKVQTIGALAFYQCGRLRDISIPDSVTSIGNQAFRGCNEIIEQRGGISYFDNWIVYALPATTTAVITPELRGIAAGVFDECRGFTTVYFTGDESEWGRFTVCENNTTFTTAKVVMNSE